MTKKGNIFITDFLENNIKKDGEGIYVSGVGDYKNNIINAIRNLTFYGLLRSITGNGKYLGTTPKIKNH